MTTSLSSRVAIFWTVVAMAGSSACSSSPPDSEIGQNWAMVSESDGTTSLYGGRDILGRLSRNELATTREFYSRLRVGPAVLAWAAGQASGLVTLSMEEIRESPDKLVELTIHTNALQRDPMVFEDIVLKAGDPLVTGRVQVIYRSDQTPPLGGGYSVTRYVRSVIGSYAEQIWETGLLPDPEMPSLQFNPPPSWSQLPAHWQ